MLQQCCSLVLNFDLGDDLVVVQPGLNEENRGGKCEIWCSRVGLCHRALEGGGGARGFLQCRSEKLKP